MSNGILSQISIAKESEWGVPVTPTKSIPVSFGGGIKTDNDIQTISAARGNLAKDQDAFVGARKHEGEFEMDFIPDYLGYFLLTLFGGLSSAQKSGETVVYEHSFSESENKPSLTIEQAVGEDVRRYAGARANSLKVSAKAGEVVKASFGIIAKSQAAASKISGAYSNLRPFNFAEAIIKIDGVQMNSVSNFEFEYKNGLEYTHAINGSNDPAISYTKGSEVTGKIEMFLDSGSAAELVDYLNKTEKTLELDLVGDAIGTGSNQKFELPLPRVIYTAAEEKIAEDANLVTISFRGLFDSVTAKLISAKLTNLIANFN